MAMFSVRVESKLLELADAIAELIAKSSVTGRAPKRAEIMRAALERGLEQMLAELKGGATRKRK